MKNADMPAMPIHCTNSDEACYGMTKRETMAMNAMRGYMSVMAWSDGNGSGVTPSYEEVAKEAVEYADALLAELDKTQSN